MAMLRGIRFGIRLLVAITALSLATFVFVANAAAKERPQSQKPNTMVQFQSACTWGGGLTTVRARPSGKSIQVQTTCQLSTDGTTTVIARPFGSEDDKYVCVGECRVVKRCLLQYCYNETVCNPCARIVVVTPR